MNIADLRDAFLGARAELDETIQETIDEFRRPDQVLQLGLIVANMPPEVAALLDDRTKAVIGEVLNGKKSAV